MIIYLLFSGLACQGWGLNLLWYNPLVRTRHQLDNVKAFGLRLKGILCQNKKVITTQSKYAKFLGD